MARAVWSGVLSFGLVSVPVALYSATEEHTPDFHQYVKGTSQRVRYQRVSEKTGKEVDYADVVKGAKVGRKLVTLDQDELDSVAPGKSRSLEIAMFVDRDDVDPLYFNKTYWLGPGSDESKKTYALLRDAMAAENMVAIGMFVMRGRQHLACVRPDGDLLALETMFFADEVRDPKREIDNLPGKVKLGTNEKKMARQLVASMSGSFRAKDYRDTYTDAVEKLLQAKAKNQDVEVAEDAPDATDVVDLMEALRASVANAKSGRSGPAKTKQPAAKKTAAKRTAAKGTATKGTATKKATAKKKATKKSAA
ncbi:MAG: end-binding protein Ku [Pseudonocardiales bacterium]|nr:end-binding protein Ku [Pseudonocardiales bacterium]